jgi:hypothetical protein
LDKKIIRKVNDCKIEKGKTSEKSLLFCSKIEISINNIEETSISV